VAPPPAGSPPAHATTYVFNYLCYLTARTTPAVEASGTNEPYPDRRSVRVPRIHSRWHAWHRAPREREKLQPVRSSHFSLDDERGTSVHHVPRLNRINLRSCNV
jgi:hypothetical protein